MSRFDDPAIVSHYNFSRSAASTSRPHSGVPSKDAVNDMFNVGIDNRSQLQRSDSSLFSPKRLVRHQVHVPTASLVTSPPIINQRGSTPDQNVTFDRPSSALISARFSRSTPIRLKSTSLAIPPTTDTEEISYQNFPKHNHEKRKIAHERKRRKQQLQIFSDKRTETETWRRLRRSLVELKRLATTQDILIDPSTSLFNCDGHTCAVVVKPTVIEQQEEKKAAAFKSESVLGSSEERRSVTDKPAAENHRSTAADAIGIEKRRRTSLSSSFGSAYSSRELNRPSLTASQSSFSRPVTAKRPTETYPRIVFEPLIVASKPIHSVYVKSGPLIKPRTKSSRPSSHFTIALDLEDKHPELLITDHSNDDNRSISSSSPPPPPPPPPPVIKSDQEIPSRNIVTPTLTRKRAPSTIPVTPTIKLKSQMTRCRSATESKPSYTTNKTYPRFIVIADEDHRIESWYHQYPFVLSDDLFSSYECKQSQQKLTISAYFIDDLQTSNPNVTAKTFLQGKPFHINNDWRKYDVIFISNNIYEQIMIHLRPIMKSMKSSGKIIKIYQINHDEDLKKQVRNLCKQLQQQ